MKGDVETFFAAFRFKVGDRLRSRSQPEVIHIVLCRLLPEGMDWQPVYQVAHITPDGHRLVNLMQECELVRA